MGTRTCRARNGGSGRQAYKRINAITQHEAKQDPRVITGTLLVFGHWGHVLIDPGAKYSFMSPQFAQVVNPQPTSFGFDMFIQLPHGDLFCAQWEFRDCPVIVERELMEANLIPFKLVEFDIILGMD
ncbi:hypothetical protein TB1_017127 [Malus domestica]